MYVVVSRAYDASSHLSICCQNQFCISFKLWWTLWNMICSWCSFRHHRKHVQFGDQCICVFCLHHALRTHHNNDRGQLFGKNYTISVKGDFNDNDNKFCFFVLFVQKWLNWNEIRHLKSYLKKEYETNLDKFIPRGCKLGEKSDVFETSHRLLICFSSQFWENKNKNTNGTNGRSKVRFWMHTIFDYKSQHIPHGLHLCSWISFWNSQNLIDWVCLAYSYFTIPWFRSSDFPHAGLSFFVSSYFWFSLSLSQSMNQI